jgi:hypothetical protein
MTDDVPDLPLAAQRLSVPLAVSERSQVVGQCGPLFVDRLPRVYDRLQGSYCEGFRTSNN